MVALLTPNFDAMVRVLQCVASAGVVCRVASTIALTNLSLVRRLLRPCGASSAKPVGPCSVNRLRHSNTVGRVIPSWAAMELLEFPSAASRQIRERSTILCAVVGACTQASSVCCCSALIGKGLVGCHMPTPYHGLSNCISITQSSHNTDKRKVSPLVSEETSGFISKWL